MFLSLSFLLPDHEVLSGDIRTVDAAGLSSDVKVYRDDYGVPHILRVWSMTPTMQSVMFMLGPIVADGINAAGWRGRLSEVLGEPALKIDKMFRTLGSGGSAADAPRCRPEDTSGTGSIC